MIKGMVIRNKETNEFTVISRPMTLKEGLQIRDLYETMDKFEVFMGSKVTVLRSKRISNSIPNSVLKIVA